MSPVAESILNSLKELPPMIVGAINGFPGANEDTFLCHDGIERGYAIFVIPTVGPAAEAIARLLEKHYGDPHTSFQQEFPNG